MTISEKLIDALPEEEQKVIDKQLEMSLPMQQAEINGANRKLAQVKKILKTVRVDEKKLYKFLKSIKGCNIAHLDTDWCELVNVKDLAEAIANNPDVVKIGNAE